MDANAINNLCISLESYMSQLRHRVDGLKREASDVENNTSKLKQRIVAGVTALVTNDPAVNNAAQVEARHIKQEEKSAEEHLKSIKDTIAAIEKHLSEVDTAHTELRRQEMALRDTELKAAAWVSRAQDLMSRGTF